MRLFIGIPMAVAVAERLAGIRKRLERAEDGLRWSSPESWHITLQFLGATSQTQYACIVERLQRISAPPLSVRLQGLGFFDRAGVFFADVQVSPQLTLLQQAVTQATSLCGFMPEDRLHRPHITLARRKGQSGDALRSLKRNLESDYAGTQFPGFTAGEFLLYESFPGPSGSRYEVRAGFRLSLG